VGDEADAMKIGRKASASRFSVLLWFFCRAKLVVYHSPVNCFTLAGSGQARSGQADQIKSFHSVVSKLGSA